MLRLGLRVRGLGSVWVRVRIRVTVTVAARVVVVMASGLEVRVGGYRACVHPGTKHV